MATIEAVLAKIDAIGGRLRKLENEPLAGALSQPQAAKPHTPIDPEEVHRALLADPSLGEAIRLKMLQLQIERVGE